MMYIHVFFFFKQKTAYEMRISDWSSDVCSSDLRRTRARGRRRLSRLRAEEQCRLQRLQGSARAGAGKRQPRSAAAYPKRTDQADERPWLRQGLSLRPR